jgi:uncharacterized membrane protein
MSQLASIHISNAGRSEHRSSAVQRWGAVIGGSALAIYGLSRRSPAGIVMAASGGALAYLGANNQTFQRREPVTGSSLLINCTPEEAYRFWRDFENLPRFMNHLESVTVLDDRRSRWTAFFGTGQKISWEAEIIGERENEFIAWRSLPGSDIEISGRVDFQKAPANRGTIITAAMQFRPPAGALGRAVGQMFRRVPNFLMRQDLRRLEALMETGEIPTTTGQPHGPRSAITGVLRVANPSRPPISRESKLTEVFSASRRIS